jgi:hypothetical protein
MPWMTDADHAQATMMLNVINGLRGFCVQPYDEMNKKRGLQWEASREISATAGTKYYSILKAGSVHPVDLKSRVLSATGDGIIARVYRITSSDYTGGAADPVYNMRPSIGTVLGAQVLTGFTLTTPVANLTKSGADLVLRVNSQGAQGGFTPDGFGSNRIVDVNEQILLEIESLGAQFVFARLEFYEGPLDYPLP